MPKRRYRVGELFDIVRQKFKLVDETDRIRIMLEQIGGFSA